MSRFSFPALGISLDWGHEYMRPFYSDCRCQWCLRLLSRSPLCQVAVFTVLLLRNVFKSLYKHLPQLITKNGAVNEPYNHRNELARYFGLTTESSLFNCLVT
jgi:hypothetical protein